MTYVSMVVCDLCGVTVKKEAKRFAVRAAFERHACVDCWTRIDEEQGEALMDFARYYVSQVRMLDEADRDR